ncbi:receptor activity-modifying protein 3-like isoform X1 [Conger conger]|uniref:receptor activity-modifying protein 3-like isoform X1 n=2 Tax=Conger conger TaxID=82655 RepID=UPI002A5AAAE2|nr:receptor activity-modifying protein 3-like isoform X1 [Conger conger]
MSAELWKIVMDENALLVSKLFLVGILTTTVMTSGLSATEDANTGERVRAQADRCNDTALLDELEKCAGQFRADMAVIHPRDWCNITHFIREYNYFSACTEIRAVRAGCYWPNPQVERYIVGVHGQFFSNCSLESVVLVDPPDDTVTVLIAVPVLLTLAMISLVVWRSKRSDMLA